MEVKTCSNDERRVTSDELEQRATNDELGTTNVGTTNVGTTNVGATNGERRTESDELTATN
jgi:hypothetical protein